MNKQFLIAICLSVLLLAGYLASITVNTAVITSLPDKGFAIGFIILAVTAGFIGYAFASPLQSRLARRLTMIGCLALGLFAGGSAWRAIAIQRLFAQPLTTHQDLLSISRIGGGKIGLHSPYTSAVFELPTTIAPGSDFDSFSYVTRCARVQIEETAGGDKRIVKGGPPIAEGDIADCPAR